MKYVRDLQFEEKPDYSLLLDLLKSIATKEGFSLDDKQFDWVSKEPRLNKQIYIEL